MLGWYKSEKSELFHKARAFCATSNGDKCISACRISEYGILAVISGKGDENYCVNINHSMQIPEEKLPSVLLGRAWVAPPTVVTATQNHLVGSCPSFLGLNRCSMCLVLLEEA